MADAIGQLQKILELEIQRGYRNDAVVGGLDEYARQWNFQVVALIDNKETAERIAQIVQMLSDYDRLPAEARPSTIRHLRESLAVLGDKEIRRQGDRETRRQVDR